MVFHEEFSDRNPRPLFQSFTKLLNPMKNLFITLLLVGFSFTGFAQKAFTQETLNGILAEYKKDSKVFFNSYCSNDFRYTNTKLNGTYQYKKDLAAEATQSIESTEMLEPVIFSSGDLAVVSGIHQTVRIKKDGSKTTGRVACTYTFQRQKGKWMFAAAQQMTIASEAK